jgi:8-oxo-dGTP diphosphatase
MRTDPAGHQEQTGVHGPEALAVAVAVLEQGDRWLIQLRDDTPGIVAAGTWGLFGGHLEPGETAAQALRRELLEEIGWQAAGLWPWFRHTTERRVAHFFRVSLTVPLEQLRLGEGQDFKLAHLAELRGGDAWSPRLGERRPLAPALRLALRQLQAESRGGTALTS